MQFKVIDNLKYDGDRYASGDTVEMDRKEGDALVEQGVLERMPAPKKGDKSGDGSTGGDTPTP